MKKYTELNGYTKDSPQIQWFWEVLAAMDSSEIGLFLQFVTGCSKIPLDGFKNLQGMRGVMHFSIHKKRIAREEEMMRLPEGHTCFNQLDMPEYPTKELL
jgi:E3 ubiquitin-protein ligase HUWE1